MKVVVKKFGGTSVGDIARIRNVARLIKEFKAKEPETQIVLVVSAMAGETNKLVTLARNCVDKPEPRELDVLLATGEQVSIALLSMALIELGLPAKSLMAQQARIVTDGRYTSANILDIDTSAVNEVFTAGAIPVVAGFQGVNDLGDVTTLGRGGSDITAVSLAAALNARCYIYTDVEGVYTADPRVCPNARRLKSVAHEEMLEMAGLGAKVLHPRSVFFAMRYKVPLMVLSTFNPGQGTWIVSEEELMEKPLITGITQRSDEAQLTVHSFRGGIKSLDVIFSALANLNVSVDMITHSGTENNIGTVSFTVPDEQSSAARECIEQLVPEIQAEGVSISRNIAKISVVGLGMRYHSEVAAKVFSALAREDIPVDSLASSEIKISLIVARKFADAAVRALHGALL